MRIVLFFFALCMSGHSWGQGERDLNGFSQVLGKKHNGESFFCRVYDGFFDNGDGTVTDPRSGLIWKKCFEGMDWDGRMCISDYSKYSAGWSNWYQAMEKAAGSHFLGKDDWRLPSKKELEAVVGFVETPGDNKCALHSSIDVVVSRSLYNSKISSDLVSVWSYSPSSLDASNNAVVAWFGGHYGYGGTISIADRDKKDHGHVRLVRGGNSNEGSRVEFRRELSRLSVYSGAQESEKKQAADRERRKQVEENEAISRRRAADERFGAAACRDRYVGQRISVGRTKLFNVEVVGKVVGVGRSKMTIEYVHPGRGLVTEEAYCHEY